MENINIRNCKVQDFQQLKYIYQECINFHLESGYNLEKVLNAPELFLEYIKALYLMENSLVLVAESDGKILGYIICKIGEKPPVYKDIYFGEIDNLAVAVEYQRRGIGQKLFMKAQEWFKTKGITRIELMITVGNEKSNNFWQKMGFETFMNLMEHKI